MLATCEQSRTAAAAAGAVAGWLSAVERMSQKQPNPQPQRYEFRIRGHVRASTLSAFPDLAAETDGADTLLTGRLADPAALYGVVAQIERLGLELLEISRLPQN